MPKIGSCSLLSDLRDVFRSQVALHHVSGSHINNLRGFKLIITVHVSSLGGSSLRLCN